VGQICLQPLHLSKFFQGERGEGNIQCLHNTHPLKFKNPIHHHIRLIFPQKKKKGKKRTPEARARHMVHFSKNSFPLPPSICLFPAAWTRKKGGEEGKKKKKKGSLPTIICYFLHSFPDHMLKGHSLPGGRTRKKGRGKKKKKRERGPEVTMQDNYL